MKIPSKIVGYLYLGFVGSYNRQELEENSRRNQQYLVQNNSEKTIEKEKRFYTYKLERNSIKKKG